ncbi:MAG: hypothetical protein WA137_01930 [Methanothrix sp.]
MISTAGLQKRLDILESRPTTEPDLVSMVLTTLNDADLELLQEQAALREAGFDEEQTASMMGERYKRAQEAVTNFHKGYQEAEKAAQASRGIYGL